MLQKSDKRLVVNVIVTLATGIFALFAYLYFTRNPELSATIFGPALALSNWVALIVFSVWFIVIILFHKKKIGKSKMSEWKKATLMLFLSIITFWFVFFLVDYISANPDLNKLANEVLQLNVFVGLLIFWVYFIGISALIVWQNKRK